jgi:hypothetical protein
MKTRTAVIARNFKIGLDLMLVRLLMLQMTRLKNLKLPYTMYNTLKIHLTLFLYILLLKLLAYIKKTNQCTPSAPKHEWLILPYSHVLTLI